MKAAALRKHLGHSFRHGMKNLIVSAPGIGKSQIVAAAARDVGADLEIMHPAVSDPTDFKGMPALVTKETQTLAEFLPFGQLRKLIEAKSLTVAFFDDLGQAPAAVQAAIMQPLEAREIDGHKISPHVVFAGATNDASHMAGVSGILEPVKSRWNAIIHLQFDVDDWVHWAINEGQMPPELIAFARFRPGLIHDFKATRELTNSSCPRTVATVGKWLNTGVSDWEVIAGAAGAAFATEFCAFLRIWRQVADIDTIIANPLTAPVPRDDQPDLAIATAIALSFKATKTNFAAIIQYLCRLQKEWEVFGVMDAIRRDPKLGDSAGFTKWSVANTQHIG